MISTSPSPLAVFKQLIQLTLSKEDYPSSFRRNVEVTRPAPRLNWSRNSLRKIESLKWPWIPAICYDTPGQWQRLNSLLCVGTKSGSARSYSKSKDVEVKMAFLSFDLFHTLLPTALWEMRWVASNWDRCSFALLLNSNCLCMQHPSQSTSPIVFSLSSCTGRSFLSVPLQSFDTLSNLLIPFQFIELTCLIDSLLSSLVPSWFNWVCSNQLSLNCSCFSDNTTAAQLKSRVP